MKMIYEIAPERHQQMLFPYVIEDFVNKDAPVRFIDSFIESLDLKELGIKVIKAVNEGRPGYNTEMLIKILVYGYYKKIISFRKLEEACRSDVNFIWLSGALKPDHNTIWRFFKKNKKKIKKLFKKSVKLAVKAGMVDFVLSATDGCKIKADASKIHSLHKRDLDLIFQELDNHIDNYMKKVYEENKSIKSKNLELPGFLRNNEDRKEWIRKQLSEMDEEEKLGLLKGTEEKLEKLEESNTKHLSLTDADCRMMKCEGKMEMAYNAQATSDNKAQIIMAADVTNKENDRHELVSNLDEVKENTGRVADENLADSDYFTGEELYKAEQKNYNVLVNIDRKTLDGRHSRESNFHKTNFEYNEKENCYYCPYGGKLEFSGNKKERRGYYSKSYRCKSYKNCSYRWECSSAKRGREIYISPYLQNIEEQLDKQKNEDNKLLLKKRIGIVEPVFAHIKHIMGFRRWTLRGIDNVKAQWSLICLTHNLKKIYKLWKIGDLQLAC